MGKNESVDEGHTKWLDEPGSGPRATCCTPLAYAVIGTSEATAQCIPETLYCTTGLQIDWPTNCHSARLVNFAVLYWYRYHYW